MKKNLNIQEIQNSKWPQIFESVFGENLISAFIHGNCLMEGFSALEEPWHISFILKDNSEQELQKLKPHVKAALRENLTFGFFFCPADIVKSLNLFPLEYLHIANKNVTLCGVQPIAGYVPDKTSLRRECDSELCGILTHLRKNIVNAKSSKKVGNVYEEARNALLPVLYGIYYLDTGVYPESTQEVKEKYTTLFQENGDEFVNAVKALLSFTAV